MNEVVCVKFEEGQQQCIDLFKHLMTKAMDEAMGKFYSDVTPYAVTDAHTNFKNALRDELREEFKNEIATMHTHYSWAHSIRMDLLNNHKDELQNKIIEDLQEQIERLKQEINQIYSRYR